MTALAPKRVFRVIPGGHSNTPTPTPHIKAPERIGDILAEPLPEWQIDGLIPRASTVVLFGDSQAGKTFFALDLAASIATGRPFTHKSEIWGTFSPCPQSELS